MRYIALCAIVTLAGCAMVKSKIVATGPGTYSTTSDAHFTGTGKVRDNVLERANEFCAQKGMTAKTLKLEDKAGPRDVYSASLEFTCIK